MLDIERCARAFALLAVACGLAAGCGSEASYRDALLGEGWDAGAGDEDAAVAPPMADGGEADGSGPDIRAKCLPAITSEPLPAREAVLERGAAVGGKTGVFTADLFSQFVDHCGSCHAGLAAQGTLNVNATNFATRIGGEALQRIRSDDPMMHMPPPPLGKPFSSRADNDPIIRFAGLLEQWIAAGRPVDLFYPEGAGDEAGESPYLLSEPVGMQMTNLGNCVPEPAMVATEPDKADELDARFARMKSFDDLPTSLRDTDLFTLDAEVLARHGVIGFAPAYTLWADNAKKIRMIRVPRGKSVRFDPESQSFDIPANTRIYKTFLKEVVDFEGNKRYRKIESRIIISRPDDGDEHTAIFGSYKWNDAETEATLQKVPYRDGTGFADDVFTYVQDEQIEDEVLRQAPNDLATALREQGATRTYAIPGSDRCVHCHMGSPQKNFILGFLPLQLQRRETGEGGVIEAAGRDELNQVQRLIDYGVITGMASPEEITLLEDSQGERKPRNEHELNAQGYMVGNCAHCHNPRGFPSRREPVLADVLDFMPSDTGGVFELPLEKSSPRIFRGESQRVPAPYISPSLYDMPAHALYENLENSGAYMQKWIKPPREPDDTDKLNVEVLEAALRKYDVIVPYTYGPGRPLLAPWRSLIYRNVDSPFSYQDGNTMFPHMPMDTPGFDCRARQLMGKWMTSIPTRWKIAPQDTRRGSAVYDALELLDADPFPHEEVLPGAPDYERAQSDAKARLVQFEASPRHAMCPDPKLDIVAPEVARGERTAPLGETVSIYGEDGETVVEGFSMTGLPARPHYFKTDLREDANWGIRRSDWFEVLVEDGVDVTKPESNRTALIESTDALAVLSTVTLDDAFKAFALTPVPFGLWTPKAECGGKLDDVPTVASIPRDQRPAWMAYADAPDDAHVYQIAPGPQVFSAICSKCHGPLGDGQSALAATIADLSGGLARVANLRAGLFGPIDDPGANRHEPSKFGRADGLYGLTVDQWAARYVAWMGMSGTNASIPSAAVAQIGAAVVLGEAREANIMAVQDESAAANMLSAVKAACELLLPRHDRFDFDDTTGALLGEAGTRTAAERKRSLEGAGLIFKNGDAELWRRLCNYGNPAPVRVVTNLEGSAGKAKLGILNVYSQALDQNDRLFDRAGYPASAEVGSGGDVVTGITDDNSLPWCVKASESELAELEATAERDLPRCPDVLFAQDGGGRMTHALTREQVNRWALRGAANAGLAVFAYLDAVAKGEIERLPAYDHCEQLE